MLGQTNEAGRGELREALADVVSGHAAIGELTVVRGEMSVLLAAVRDLLALREVEYPPRVDAECAEG